MENINNTKTLSTTKIIYLIILLLFSGMVILYASGTFKTPAIDRSNVVENKSTETHNHTADMTALNNIKSLENVVENNPNDLNSLLQLSHLLNDSGFYDKAITNYKKYLEKNSTNVDVIIDMGVCYYQLKDFDAAIKTMKKGVALDPNHQIANFNLGIVSSANGNHDEAVKYWKLAVNINPSSDIGKKAQNLLDNH
jgi:tetratricopeptide (TPR) repeat protein